MKLSRKGVLHRTLCWIDQTGWQSNTDTCSVFWTLFFSPILMLFVFIDKYATLYQVRLRNKREELRNQRLQKRYLEIVNDPYIGLRILYRSIYGILTQDELELRDHFSEVSTTTLWDYLEDRCILPKNSSGCDIKTAYEAYQRSRIPEIVKKSESILLLVMRWVLPWGVLLGGIGFTFLMVEDSKVQAILIAIFSFCQFFLIVNLREEVEVYKLLWAFFKNVHDKTCAPIEWIEDNDESGKS